MNNSSITNVIAGSMSIQAQAPLGESLEATNAPTDQIYLPDGFTLGQAVTTNKRRVISVIDPSDTWDKLPVHVEPILNPHTNVTYHIPFVATAYTGEYNAKGEPVAVPIKPDHVRALESFVKTGDFDMAVKFANTAAINAMIFSQITYRASTIEGRTVIDPRLQPGEITHDDEHIYHNPTDAHRDTTDMDGDRGSIVKNKSSLITGNDKVFFAKNPITIQMKPLTLISIDELNRRNHHFLPWNEELVADAIKRAQVNQIRVEGLEEQLAKNKTPEIGLLDSALKLNQLMTYKSKPYDEMIKLLYSTDIAVRVLEEGALKGVSKEDKTIEDTDEILRELLGDEPIVLDHPFAPLITRTGSVSNGKSWGWFYNQDLEEIYDRASKLDVDIRIANPGKKKLKYYVKKDGGLIQRMRKLGIFKAYPFKHLSGMTMYAVELVYPREDGKVMPIALRDVKRDGSSFDATGFFCILVPVWNAVTKEWVDPLVHMDDVLSLKVDPKTGKILSKESDKCYPGIDTCIRHPKTKDFVRFMFEKMTTTGGSEDLTSGKYPYKIDLIIKAISSYVGEYGVLIGGKQDDRRKLSDEGKSMAASRVVVDYMIPRDEIQDDPECWDDAFLREGKSMATLFKEIDIPLCPSSKGKNPRVRRYCLSHKDNPLHPIYGCPGKTNARRSANVASQLTNSVRIGKLRHAIILTDVLDAPEHENQVTYLTPSGVDKQRIKTAFSPRVSPVPDEDHKEMVEYCTPEGKRAVAFLQNPKLTSICGKLIRKTGFKTVPGRCAQFYTRSKDNTCFEDIDILLSVHEIIAKGDVQLLEDSELRVIEYRNADGKRIKVYALVGESMWFRTLQAGENMPVRNRIKTFKGFDAHLAIAAARECGFREPIMADKAIVGKDTLTEVFKTKKGDKMVSVEMPIVANPKIIGYKEPEVDYDTTYAEWLKEVVLAVLDDFGFNAESLFVEEAGGI